MNPADFSAALSRGHAALRADDEHARWIKRLRRAIRRLVLAHEADSWKGGGDPDDIPAIERELKAARKALNALLR